MMLPRTINPMICFVRMVGRLSASTIQTGRFSSEGQGSCIRWAFRASTEHHASNEPPTKPAQKLGHHIRSLEERRRRAAMELWKRHDRHSTVVPRAEALRSEDLI
jgi:hypothetical protein